MGAYDATLKHEYDNPTENIPEDFIVMSWCESRIKPK